MMWRLATTIFTLCVYAILCTAGLCVQSRLYLYIYRFVKKKQAVYCLTVQKSPTKCTFSLSKSTSSVVCYVQRAACTDRVIHTFLLEQRGILYYGTQSMCMQQRSQC